MNDFETSPRGTLLGEAPATSIARLKAQWQAEALEDFADDMTVYPNEHTARSRAERLRRQAEETV